MTPRESRLCLSRCGKQNQFFNGALFGTPCSLHKIGFGCDVFLADGESEVNYDPSWCVRCENGNYLTPDLLDVFQRSGFDPYLFAAPQLALDCARRMFGVARGPIVVTVRSSSFEVERNAGSDFSVELLEGLLQRGKTVFLIPDQETEIETASVPKGVKVLHEASF